MQNTLKIQNHFQSYLLKKERRLIHANVNTCHICKGEIKVHEKKVIDHCNIQGHVRSVAHNKCNLNYRIDPKRWKLPIVIHGLRNYDSHLLINALQRKDRRIRVIWRNI